MTTEEARLLALTLAAIWSASGVLALCHRRIAAAAINLLFAVPLCLLSAWPIVRVLVDIDGYIRQYGRAALHELPLSGALLALSLLAVVCSLLSIRRPAWVFVVGWLANAPTLVLLMYLAFWFRIF